MRIYNSLTRNKEEFSPIKKDKIGMYVCGPTVYDEPHIGHARSAYIFDVIRRYFIYRGYRVTFVRNVTDVDDKIIEKAKSSIRHQPSAISLKDMVKEISERYLDAYHEDMALLRIGKPDKEPKATEYIPKMVKFIQALIKKGCAYESDGDVYFDIKKAKDYGKLSNQNLGKMEIGARIAPGEKKKDPLDFALWKKAKEDEPAWDSPWEKGRPGWHIECSVMSSDILGVEFDIHGGGIDLIFPHHENEIAQSEGAGEKFARYWIHNGLLTINGEKMAKSLGNFISIKDFIAKYKDADYLKMLFLSTHYRHPVDYSDEKVEEARRAKERGVEFFNKVDETKEIGKSDKTDAIKELKQKFIEAMDDDFNTPEALAAIFGLISLGNTLLMEGGVSSAKTIKSNLYTFCAILGISFEQAQIILEEEERKLLKEREEARKAKDFKKADSIRKELGKKGVILEDTKDGTVWRRQI